MHFSILDIALLWLQQKNELTSQPQVIIVVILRWEFISLDGAIFWRSKCQHDMLIYYLVIKKERSKNAKKKIGKVSKLLVAL